MTYDRDKVDEATLALLYLVVCEKNEKFGTARAWKSFDWDTMNRLHEKGYIADPVWLHQNKMWEYIEVEEGEVSENEKESCHDIPTNDDEIPF